MTAQRDFAMRAERGVQYVRIVSGVIVCSQVTSDFDGGKCRKGEYFKGPSPSAEVRIKLIMRVQP